MRKTREKDFEYYENQAAYFAYTHDPDDYDIDFSDEYLELDPKVIKSVEEQGARDQHERFPKKSLSQLSEFVISEGLLTKEKADLVVYDLYMDYSMSYDCCEAKSPKEVVEFYERLGKYTCGGDPKVNQIEGMGELDTVIICKSCGRSIHQSDYDRENSNDPGCEELALRKWNAGMTQEEIDRIKEEKVPFRNCGSD